MNPVGRRELRRALKGRQAYVRVRGAQFYAPISQATAEELRQRVGGDIAWHELDDGRVILVAMAHARYGDPIEAAAPGTK